MTEKCWTWTTTAAYVEGKSAETMRDLCTTAGLAGIEASLPWFATLTDPEVETLCATMKEAGVGFPTFHLPFPEDDDITSFYNAAREEAVERIEQAMEVATRLGSSIGIQHPTTTGFDAEVEGVDRYLEQLGRSLEVLLPVAERLGFTIAIENLLPATTFGSSPEHITRIRETFDHPHLGFCLDTGHALVSLGDAAPEVQEAMGDRLVAYHLADNAGDRDSHLAPGHGRVDWSTVFRKAAEAGFSGHMCIETPPFAPGPEYSGADWKQMVDDCDELVAAALDSRSNEGGVR